MSGHYVAAVLSDGSSVSLELLEEALHWHRYSIYSTHAVFWINMLGGVFDLCA
jgi:hypothetical protein